MINMKKLITEEVKSNKPKLQESADLVRSGLEKVFTAGGPEISYRRLENVGLGYIRNISEAFKCAITEGRKLAKSFGYKDDETNEKFIKEENNFGQMSAENPEDRMAQVQSHEGENEADMNQPEEKREVVLGKKILQYAELLKKYLKDEVGGGKYASANAIAEYAKELIEMHGGK